MSCCDHAPRGAGFSRRAALGAIALGGGVSLLTSFTPRRAFAAGHADALLLNCMDYRLTNDVTRYMDQRGLTEKYDQIILAGASLGALNDKYPSWTEVFWAHLDLAIQLHQIHKLIVIDHRDCGAYKLLLGEAAVKDPDTELKSHVTQLYALRSTVLTRYPHLEVELGLMALDGSVLPIA
jgi:carbonic anhydrase